jgi:hypothetical protein
MPGCGFLNLEKLAFDRAHSGHEAIKLDEEELFVLPRLFDEIGRGTVSNPMKSIGQLHVQEPHSLLQIHEFLM